MTTERNLLKDQILEVLGNCKVGLIGSGAMLATKVVAELSGESQVRFIMMYIGLFVGLLTIVKLLFELGPAWERFQESLEKRRERKMEQRRGKRE